MSIGPIPISGQILSGFIANNAVVSGSIGSGQIGDPHFANGAILSGSVASGQVAAVHLSTGVGGGQGMVLLELHSASNSPSLDFTTGFSSAYDEYEIEVVNIMPTANNTSLLLECSTSGGTSWDTTGGHYKWTIQYSYPPTNAGANGSSSDSSMTTIGNIYTTSGLFGVCGSVRVYQPASSTMYKNFLGQFISVNNSISDLLRISFGGCYLSTAPVNGLRFIMASGNISGGSIRMYGIAH